MTTVKHEVQTIFSAQNNMGGALSGVSAGMLNVKNLSIATGVAMAAMFAKDTIAGAIEFEEAIAKVNTIASTTPAQIDKLRASSVKYGKDATDLAGALYEINSASIQGSAGMKVLDAATKASVAGWVSVRDAADACTDILNAYMLQAEDAEYVTDVLLKTVELGKLQFEDFEGQLGRVAKMGYNLGVSFEEQMAVIAELTKSGLDASEAFTGLLGIYQALLKPTEELNTTVRDLGYESVQSMMELEGFIGTLQVLNTAADGDNEALAAMFGRVRGLNAIMSTVSADGGAALLSTLGKLEDSAGTTEEKMATMMDTTAFKMAQLTSAWDEFKLSVGELGIDPTIDAVNNLVDALTYLNFALDSLDQFNGQKSLFNSLQDAFLSLGGNTQLSNYVDLFNQTAEYIRLQDEALLNAELDAEARMKAVEQAHMDRWAAMKNPVVEEYPNLLSPYEMSQNDAADAAAMKMLKSDMTLWTSLVVDKASITQAITDVQAEFDSNMIELNVSTGKSIVSDIIGIVGGGSANSGAQSDLMGTVFGGFLGATDMDDKQLAEFEEMKQVAEEQLEEQNWMNDLADQLLQQAISDGTIAQEDAEQAKSGILSMVQTLNEYKTSSAYLIGETNSKLDTLHSDLGNVVSAINGLEMKYVVNNTYNNTYESDGMYGGKTADEWYDLLRGGEP